MVLLSAHLLVFSATDLRSLEEKNSGSVSRSLMVQQREIFCF